MGRRFTMVSEPTKEHPSCMCGKILKGVMTPRECPLFDRVCKPTNPVGPCMVSGEGTCSAFYKYHM